MVGRISFAFDIQECVCHSSGPDEYYHHLRVCDCRRGMDGILDLLTQLGTTNNYSAPANLHSSQFTIAPAKPFPACCIFSRSLSTASNSVDSSATHAQVLLSPPPVKNSSQFTVNPGTVNPVLCCYCQLSRCYLFSGILSAGLGSSLYSLGADPTENTVS
jgi:hypothetical protein